MKPIVLPLPITAVCAANAVWQVCWMIFREWEKNAKKNLLKHFGSFTKVKEATVEELMEVEGIHAAVAEEIYSYLRTHQDLQARLDARKR